MASENLEFARLYPNWKILLENLSFRNNLINSFGRYLKYFFPS